ncbi:MAG: hypothetical protein D6719_06200 [Candidatus Dadabacteria bacterium]|nr:MAG: hypothetical protein D6719_06200 [Candidatus Dadabacteria bacterium]
MTSKQPLSRNRLVPFGASSTTLLKQILADSNPEKLVRSLPAQTLHLIIQDVGMEDALEIIESATIQQRQLVLDFELWKKDRLYEEQIWKWLQLTGGKEDLALLQQLLKSIDLKIVAFLIAKYVNIIVCEEPTETPPQKGYYTPDKGSTWISINISDADKHFALARLMALIFETDAELFYQLLAIPGVATPSQLEEESYQERIKRLSAEGIPDQDLAAEINSPLSPDQAIKSSNSEVNEAEALLPRSIAPLIFERSNYPFLNELSKESSIRDDLESELTLILNAALIHWSVSFADRTQVALLLSKVRGAINLGLDILSVTYGILPLDAYQSLKLQGIYRCGLSEIIYLRKCALGVSQQSIETHEQQQAVKELLDALLEQFPCIPAFFNSDGSFIEDNGKLLTGRKAITSYSELKSLKHILTSLTNDA